MEIFNTYPRAALAPVTEDLARLVAQDDLGTLRQWGEAEWALAPQTAFVLGVGALLYSQLREREQLTELPPNFREALARQYQLNRARVMRMLDEWQQVLRALETTHVQLIPLKGIVLLENFYDDGAKRPLTDLDFLIRPENSAETRAGLESLGYIVEDHASKLNFVRADNRLPICMDAEHPDNPRRVEVHTRLEDEFRGSTIDWTEQAWTSSRAATHSAITRELDISVLWAHLLSHTSRDFLACRGRLVQLHDLALVARTITSRGCWSSAIAPRGAASARFFYPALALMRRYFGNVIPTTYLDQIAALTPPRLRAWCEEQSLFDVSWLGGQHLGAWQTLTLWPQSPREMFKMARVMWQRRALHLHHSFPELRGTRGFFFAYLAYAWDQARGSRRQRERRGRWDYAPPKEH